MFENHYLIFKINDISVENLIPDIILLISQNI